MCDNTKERKLTVRNTTNYIVELRAANRSKSRIIAIPEQSERTVIVPADVKRIVPYTMEPQDASDTDSGYRRVPIRDQSIDVSSLSSDTTTFVVGPDTDNIVFEAIIRLYNYSEQGVRLLRRDRPVKSISGKKFVTPGEFQEYVMTLPAARAVASNLSIEVMQGWIELTTLKLFRGHVISVFLDDELSVDVVGPTPVRKD